MRWLVLLVVACGPDRTFEVGNADRPLAEVMASAQWSNTSSLSLSPLGSHQFPSPLAIRLRIFELCGHDDGDECEQELTTASIAVRAGSPCATTIPVSCADKYCFAELQVTGLGNCLLSIHAETRDGYDASRCWYRAVYEAANPFDMALFDMYERKTDDEVSACDSDL